MYKTKTCSSRDAIAFFCDSLTQKKNQLFSLGNEGERSVLKCVYVTLPFKQQSFSGTL